MALRPGTRLGHYDVTSLLGEGGMGQVWQATDTRLNREVALKILPDAFAADPDRLARFTREAQILASLNHPNIAQIHGIEEAEGTRALVLELVEGPTLADRIAQGAMPIEDALPIARQIAEALEAAHEAGVIHRDLKPANIKVREDGTVKVLDFGLAKALDPNPEGDPSQSPTLTAAATQMDVIMGTAAYMAPEQARGKTVDKRADIWAFGCVLFEMLGAHRAFQGDDTSQTLAKVIEREPDWSALPSTTPETVTRLIGQCLEKHPRRRLRDIGDTLAVLEDRAAPLAGPGPEVSPKTEPRMIPRAVSVVGLTLAAGVVGYLLNASSDGSASIPRLVNAFQATSSLGVEYPALSPDTEWLAYSSQIGQQWSIWVLQLGAGQAVNRTSASPGNHMWPAWSPDGRQIAFVSQEGADRSVWVMDAFAGAP